MDSITLENYRCFGERQTARLAPLTLLVGENSTGKTSFLALIRALWNLASMGTVPNFRQAPYDLGSFREVVHDPGGRKTRIHAFAADFRENGVSYFTKFGERDTAPYPLSWGFSFEGASIEASANDDGSTRFGITTNNNQWQYSFIGTGNKDILVMPASFFLNAVMFSKSLPTGWIELIAGNPPEQHDYERMLKLSQQTGARIHSPDGMLSPFAAAPVRSQPLRTYDPIRPAWSTEGEDVPSYLANLQRKDQSEWEDMRAQLERFGTDSGLFDEIGIRSLGDSGANPFQVYVRKHGKRSKGGWRNLVDMGYGISQVLPVIVNLLRRDSPYITLLQQPEIHLHPSAQATLGSLFCTVANAGNQVIAETHSDYLVDRVRMDIRDNRGGLNPEDVSILFFERVNMDVRIHSLGIDAQGNVTNAPPSYGQFFMEEMDRSIGF